MNHKLDFNGISIEVYFPYDAGYSARIHEIPYSKWNSVKRCWEIAPSFLFSVLSLFPGFIKSVGFEFLEEQKRVKESKASTTALDKMKQYDFKAKIGNRTLFNHQIETAVEIIEKRKVILAHPLGAGKTSTALIAAKIIGLPIYVIAPKSLKINWEREAYILGVPLKQIISWAKIPHPPSGDFTVLLDECHAAQSLLARRSQRALTFCANASYVVPITGTPCKNGRPENLYPLLCLINHPLATSKKAFEKTFCRSGGKEISSWQSNRSSNLNLLYEQTKDYILRKRIEDCVDLPEKIRILRAAELTPEAAYAYENTFTTLKNLWWNKVINGTIVSTNEKLVMLSQLRHAASTAKIYESMKIAEELKEEGEQVNFFVAFKDTGYQLFDKLSKLGTVGIITGEHSIYERQASIDSFQKKQLDFLICTIGAGGEGITLTSGRHVVLHDRPWTSGEALQCEARHHRMGQDRTVFCHWIQCNSTDQFIDNLLLNKQKNISEILSGNRTQEEINFTITEHLDVLFDEVFKK